MIGRLETFERGDVGDIVVQTVDSRVGGDLAAIVEKSGLSSAEALSVLRELVEAGRVVQLGDRYLSSAAALSLESAVKAELSAYHQRYPLRVGMPREELKSRLRLAPREASALFDYLGTKSAIVLEDSFARLPTHAVELTPGQEERVRQFLAELAGQPFAPPALDELTGRHGIDDEILAVLIARGQVTRLTDSIAFSGEALADIRNRVIERIHSAGSINVAELRDLLDTTRKYALTLMEYFDQQRVTRRVGDTRVLR